MTSRRDGLSFGGDYNPEQWPNETHVDDVRLMAQVRVNLVTVGVFSWATLEPVPGTFEFDWLEAVLDRVHEGDIAVDLATGTASPPPWMVTLDPLSLPVDREGRRRWVGGRQAYCPSSPTWRLRSQRLAEQMASRFAQHPALALWHVGNEYGCNTPACYCDACGLEFRKWLIRRYGDIGALNEGWGTNFWSQRYSSFDDIHPPRITPDGTIPNPSQELDFRRFFSDHLLSAYVAERDILKRITPDVPVTTNFMAMSRFNRLDYWRWANEVDVVSNDHYPSSRPELADAELALCADVTRGLSRGAPWILMETAPSAVNWRSINRPRPAGQLRRHMVQHLGRGADAIMFFQWRASRAGAEKFHSAMLPHAGTDTRVFREVSELGQLLDDAGEISGSRVVAQAAMIWDWESWWSQEFGFLPTSELSYFRNAMDLHRTFTDQQITLDIIDSGTSFDAYPLVVVPSLCLMDVDVAQRLDAYVRGGGTLVVTYWSGVCDEHDRVWLGGYPGALRDTLGIWVEEFAPLERGQTVALSDGGTASVWSEFLHLRGAESRVEFTGGELDGVAAVARHEHGAGVAWYVATRLDPISLDRHLSDVLTDARLRPLLSCERGLEVTVRRGEHADYALVVNHGDAVREAHFAGFDLVTGRELRTPWSLAGGDVAVVRLEQRVDGREVDGPRQPDS